MNLVGTSTAAGGWVVGAPYQRFSFFAVTKYWCFYTNGGDMGWRTSADGIVWSAFTAIRAASPGYWFSVAFDGVNFHYVYTNTDWDGDLYYRMGTANSDGTIAWLAAEQLVLNIDANHLATDPSIAVDSNGYPWIGYGFCGPNPVYDTYAYVAKSKTKNGTWTHENVLFASPYQFSASMFTLGTYPSAWCSVIPLTSGKMYAAVQTNGPTAGMSGFTGPITVAIMFLAGWSGIKLIGADDGVIDGSVGGGNYLLNKFIAVATDTCTNVRVKCSGVGHVKVAVYADNDGYPGARLAKQDASTVVVLGWNTIALEASCDLTNGVPYWLAVISDNAIVGYDLTAGLNYYYKAEIYATFTFPDPAASGIAERNMKGRLWDGGAWGAEETCVTSDYIAAASISAVPSGDDVHVTYGIWNPSPTNIDHYHAKRTYGVGWGAPALVRARVATVMQACLSISNAGILYHFWQNEPVAKHGYYKKYIGGAWDAAPTDWFTEADALTLTGELGVVSNKSYNRVIIFSTPTLNASPYNYKMLTLLVDPLLPAAGSLAGKCIAAGLI